MPPISPTVAELTTPMVPSLNGQAVGFGAMPIDVAQSLLTRRCRCVLDAIPVTPVDDSVGDDRLGRNGGGLLDAPLLRQAGGVRSGDTRVSRVSGSSIVGVIRGKRTRDRWARRAAGGQSGRDDEDGANDRPRPCRRPFSAGPADRPRVRYGFIGVLGNPKVRTVVNRAVGMRWGVFPLHHANAFFVPPVMFRPRQRLSAGGHRQARTNIR